MLTIALVLVGIGLLVGGVSAIFCIVDTDKRARTPSGGSKWHGVFDTGIFLGIGLVTLGTILVLVNMAITR